MCFPPYNLVYPFPSLTTNAFLQEAFCYGFAQALKPFVDVRQNFFTIFKEISKDAYQKQSYKSWHRWRKCTEGSFFIPLRIWFISKFSAPIFSFLSSIFFPPVCFPMHAYIWGKIAFYTHDSNQDQVSVHSGPDNNRVSDFRTRGKKQCHAFVRQQWTLMSDTWCLDPSMAFLRLNCCPCWKPDCIQLHL